MTPFDAVLYFAQGSTANKRSQGVEGLGFSLVGIDLIYLGFLAALVSKWGTWNDDLYNLPPIKAANADMERAPAH